MNLFAVSPPGVAQVTADELRALGVRQMDVLADGVEFAGDLQLVARVNQRLRTASRVLVRIGSFHARTFAELERHAAKLDWRSFVAAGGAARFRVTARKSRLFHTGAITERLEKVAGVAAPVDGVDAVQLFVVRGVRDEWVVSADSSGENLHRRGYRLATAKAPLRETLAAAAVLVSGWNGATPLVDPFCGSGTICVEGALIAADRAPNPARVFAFQRWPAGGDAGQPEGDQSPSLAVASGPVAFGYDRDAGAIEAASGNAARASVAGLVHLAQQPVSALIPPEPPGVIVTNPPYGVRIGERGDLRDLYARFGAIVRERCAGWGVLFFSADHALARATRLRLEPVLMTENGGLEVRLMRGEA